MSELPMPTATRHLIEVGFPGGVSVTANVAGHTVVTDQPERFGGGGTAPAPFDLFLASLATCAGYFAVRFCRERSIASEGLGIAMEITKEEGALTAVDLRVTLPEGFPEKYRGAIVRAIDQCTVKRALAAPPAMSVTVA